MQRRIPSNLTAKFSSDKASLFQDWLDNGESWAAVSLVEQRRREHSKKTASTFRLVTKKELMAKYGDEAIVEEVIAAKRKANLWATDPDCPGNRAADVFLCRTDVTMQETDDYTTQQEITIAAEQPDVETVRALTTGDGRFTDQGCPATMACPAAAWDFASAGMQPSGETPEPAPATALPALPADAATASASAGTTAAHEVFARLSQLLAAPASQGSRTGDKKKRKTHGDGSMDRQKKGGRGKGGAKGKAQPSPLDRGKALRTACLSDSENCRRFVRDLNDIAGQESMIALLKTHEAAFDGLFNECNDLVKDMVTDEERWAAVIVRCEELKLRCKDTLEIVSETVKGINKRRKTKETDAHG